MVNRLYLVTFPLFAGPHRREWAADDTRYPAITLPYAESYLQAENGLRYLAPEVVMLFKAKLQRPKDQQDFDTVLPALDEQQRTRLRTWLERTEPSHRSLDAL